MLLRGTDNSCGQAFLFVRGNRTSAFIQGLFFFLLCCGCQTTAPATRVPCAEGPYNSGKKSDFFVRQLVSSCASRFIGDSFSSQGNSTTSNTWPAAGSDIMDTRERLLYVRNGGMSCKKKTILASSQLPSPRRSAPRLVRLSKTDFRT